MYYNYLRMKHSNFHASCQPQIGVSLFNFLPQIDASVLHCLPQIGVSITFYLPQNFFVHCPRKKVTKKYIGSFTEVNS